MLARVVPDSLCCIQLRPVGRKLEDFHVAAVCLEPLIGFLLFVIRSIVLNQIDPAAAAIKGGHHHLLQEGQIGLPLKVVLLMQVGEAGVIQTDSTEDFLGMSFPRVGICGWLPRLAQVACRVGGIAAINLRRLTAVARWRNFPTAYTGVYQQREHYKKN